MLTAVALGGGLGAAGRYGATLLWPTEPGGFPWTILAVNTVGCALLGVLMAAVTEVASAPHPLLRPFLGTGVLGGFTTFSAYAVGVERQADAGRAWQAAGYLALTVVAALAAVWLATAAARWALGGGRRLP